MYQIKKVKVLTTNIYLMDVEAPRVAKHCEPGQFVIVRMDDEGERIPLTICDYNRELGTVTIVFQTVGAGTLMMANLKEGDYFHDFVGPLGKKTHTDGLKKVAVVGGGVGCAIAYPVAKKLHSLGCEVHAICGFRTKDLVILENEFKNCKGYLASIDNTETFVFKANRIIGQDLPLYRTTHCKTVDSDV